MLYWPRTSGNGEEDGVLPRRSGKTTFFVAATATIDNYW
jgi:hypothetical protein